MAILNKIRQRGFILIIVIALALFSFVLADVIKNGGFSSQKSQNTVATINGKDISQQEFAKLVETTQRNMGVNATTLQAVQNVWDRELKNIIIQGQYESLGLKISPEQLRDALRLNLSNDITFQNEAGFFDENKLQEYIANLKATSKENYDQWIAYENNVIKTIVEQNYYNLIKAGMGATLAEGESEYSFEFDKVDIQYVQVPYTKIPNEDVKVSESEIRAYIKSHKDEFTIEPTIGVQYVIFTEEASKEDNDNIQLELSKLIENKVDYNSVTKMNDTIIGLKNISSDYETYVNSHSDQKYTDRVWFKQDLPVEIANSLYNLKKGDVYGPYKLGNSYSISKLVNTKIMADTAKASHILVSWKGLQTAIGVKRTKKEAKKLADSLLSQIKRNKSKFNEFAKTFSSDYSNKDNGGDLGDFTPANMIPEFSDFVFSNRVGTIDVIETEFGYHLVRIDRLTKAKKALELATIIRTIEPSEETLNDIFTNATKFEIAVGKEDFIEVANKSSYAVLPVDKVGELDENIPGAGRNRQLVSWGFNEDTNIGDIKRFNLGAGGYIIAQLINKNPKGLMSIADASLRVTPILRNKKKAKLIRASITATDTQALADEQNVQVNAASSISLLSPTLAGAGNEPKVCGAAFGLKVGETSKLIDGNNGVYMIKVTAINKAPKLDNYLANAKQLSDKRKTTASISVYNALKKMADIYDNRSNFY